MQNAKILAKHAALVDAMAEHLGVDLEEHVMRGLIEPELIPDLVLRCTKCSDPERCARLMATAERLGAAPAFCLNRKTLEEIADQSR
ncbi:MAG: DUF6455 family protein [Pseudomonadota bacterium]